MAGRGGTAGLRGFVPREAVTLVGGVEFGDVAGQGLQFLQRPLAKPLAEHLAPRILHLVQPSHVHVMYQGRIVKEGGPELVTVLEEKGYGWIKEEVAASA